MATRTRLVCALLALAPFAPPPSESPPRPAAQDAAEPERVLEAMTWLAGTWAGNMWGGRFVAYYSTPDGGKILGHSKLLKEEQEQFYEFEVFEARGDAVHLQPFPGGRKAGGFRLHSHDGEERKAVFENPDKDYPTRIVYHRVTDDELVITLSDPHGGSDKVERFELGR